MLICVGKKRSIKSKKCDVHSLSANIPLPQQAEVPPSKGEKVSP